MDGESVIFERPHHRLALLFYDSDVLIAQHLSKFSDLAVGYALAVELGRPLNLPPLAALILQLD